MEVQINGTDGDCRYPRHFQTPHCLARKYNATNFPAFPNEDYVNLLVTNVKDYASFANQVENNAHNKIHHAFGGDMMTWWSPNDHIFWLFHSFIDKIWSDWNAGAQVPQYNSTELRTILQPFGINFEDVIKSEALCYRFQPYSKSKPYGYKMV